MFLIYVLCGHHFMVPTTFGCRLSDLKYIQTLKSALIEQKGATKEKREEK